MIKSIKLFHVLVLLSIVAISFPILNSKPLLSSAAANSEKISTQINRQINTNQNVVFIQPIFTQAAYGNNDPRSIGFYDYYTGKCDKSCLTVAIPKTFYGSYSTSAQANDAFLWEHYSHITDIDVDKNPNILQKYDAVIVLHNEYVTQREFDAITHQPRVIYLYPNALYAKVQVDYNKNTITLVRGHGYPDKKIASGFDWKYDNTKFESDTVCHNLNFYNIDNGKMLNCYPEYVIYFDPVLIQAALPS